MAEEQKKKERFENLLESLQKTRYSTIVNKEVSAWAIAVLYITILGVSYQFLDMNYKCKDQYNYILLGAIMAFCSVVCVFIHTQYSICIRAVTEFYVIHKTLFGIAEGTISIDSFNWKIANKSSYPEIIEKQIDSKFKEDHSIKNICPHIIYWFLINRLMLWIKLTNNIVNYNKINLIEASLYNIVLIPTVLIIILIFYK
jgi:hypothetical protein